MPDDNKFFEVSQKSFAKVGLNLFRQVSYWLKIFSFFKRDNTISTSGKADFEN